MVADVTRPGLNEDLGVRWSELGWLEPAEDEEVTGRWLCLRSMCHVAIGEMDGLPGSLTSDATAVMEPLFDGGGPLFLTSTRIVGWIGHGATLFGTVGEREALLYTLPVGVIEELDVTRKKGWGGLKETGVMAWIDGGGFLFADLDRAVDKSRRARSSNRTESAKAIVGAVAAVQRQTATPEQAAILDRALAGEWRVGDDGDLEIELAPAGSESTDQVAPDGASSEMALAEPELAGEEVVAEPALEASHAAAANELRDDGWACLVCAARNAAEHRFCTSCGAERDAASADEQKEVGASAETSRTPGCKVCDCQAIPSAGDRFCRACGHPAKAHSSGATAALVVSVEGARAQTNPDPTTDESLAGFGDSTDEKADTVVGAEATTCWSCGSALSEGSSVCPDCGVALTEPWFERASARVQARAYEVVGGPESRPSEAESIQTQLSGVEAFRSHGTLPDARAHVGGWGPAVFLLGVLGGFIGWLTLRSSDRPRANHVLKWGAIWSAFFFVVTPIVTYLVLFAALGSLVDSYDSATDSTTEPYETTDALTTTDPVATPLSATARLGVPVVERALSVSTADGHSADLRVQVYEVSRASDFPPLPVTYRETVDACYADPKSDAVVPITYELSDTSAGRVEVLGFTFFVTTPTGPTSLGIDGDGRYSTGSVCYGSSNRSDGFVYGVKTTAPAISDGFYLIIHDYYSANRPDGETDQLVDVDLHPTVTFNWDDLHSPASPSEDVPVVDDQPPLAGSPGTTSTQPSPRPETTSLQLTPAMIAPGPPYRCVSPFARDHDGRMELEFRYASGATAKWVSADPSDTNDNFVFCGGSATHNLPGYASAPIHFRNAGRISRIVLVGGMFGADRDAGAPGRRVELVVSYNGQRVCHLRTDASGHARRFKCRGFPSSSTLAPLELRLDVTGDRRQGVFAGIADLEATVER